MPRSCASPRVLPSVSLPEVQRWPLSSYEATFTSVSIPLRTAASSGHTTLSIEHMRRPYRALASRARCVIVMSCEVPDVSL